MPEALDLMRAGEPYQGMDPTLVALRMAARQRCRQLNEHDMADQAGRQQLAEQLFESCGDNLWLEAPFQCDYGTQIRLGDNVFINMDCVILDCAPVTIGNNVLLGPKVQIYTPCHPLEATPRRDGVEWARPVTLGDDVWVGGGAILCPGVTVGDRAVIAAGAVVTKDVPADTVVAGNPARVIRSGLNPTE